MQQEQNNNATGTKNAVYLDRKIDSLGRSKKRGIYSQDTDVEIAVHSYNYNLLDQRTDEQRLGEASFLTANRDFAYDAFRLLEEVEQNLSPVESYSFDLIGN